MKVVGSQWSVVSKNIFCVALCAMLFALCVSADAQPPKKIPRIGFLAPGLPSSDTPRVDPFRQGLRELGYVEGQNILVEYRYAEGKLDRIPSIVAELLQLKVDVIVLSGTPAAQAAKRATTTVPIVMGQALTRWAQASSQVWRGLAETLRGYPLLVRIWPGSG